MKEKLPISAVIITKDDAERVIQLTHALLEWLEEVVVLVDDRSEPSLVTTLAAINGCTAQLYTFEGFGVAKQKAVALAKFDWVFSLDSDEMPDVACVEAVKHMDFHEPSVYKVKRLNHYGGRPVRACGWYPDYVIRVFHTSVAGFSDDVVHESVKTFDPSVSVKLLSGDILHYSFDGSHQILEKIVKYTSLYAERYQGKPKGALVIILRALFSFVKCYFLRKGIFYGRDGFIISVMNAFSVFHKHWRAAEKVREERRRLS